MGKRGRAGIIFAKGLIVKTVEGRANRHILPYDERRDFI
jgi:hypothetical protein